MNETIEELAKGRICHMLMLRPLERDLALNNYEQLKYQYDQKFGHMFEERERQYDPAYVICMSVYICQEVTRSVTTK